MKNLEMSAFAPLSTEELMNLDGGGLVTSLLGTVEGILNPLAALIDSLIGSLPLPGLPTLPGL